MRVFITGIAGFIGSHLADALYARGHIVGGNDNLLYGGELKNVPSGVKFWLGDCCNQWQMLHIMKQFKPDVVVHCAATAQEGFSVYSPAVIASKNIGDASVSTFSAAIEAGAKRIVFMSSMARYGKGTAPFREEDATQPVDPYGIFKVAAEQTLIALCKAHGVEWSICVPHNVVGPRQNYRDPLRNVASIFLNRLKRPQPELFIYGDGKQQRSFSPIKDCIFSMVKMVEGHADGEVINIGPDEDEITITELAFLCADIVGVQPKITYMPPRQLTDDVKEAYCSADKARRLLGYKPQQSLRECLVEMARGITPDPFNYDMFPIEINSPKIPKTWKERL